MPSRRALTPAARRRRSGRLVRNGDVLDSIVKSVGNAMSMAIAVMMPSAASRDVNDKIRVL
jgi:hypothetical protein